jgi:hypothetical protein
MMEQGESAVMAPRASNQDVAALIGRLLLRVNQLELQAVEQRKDHRKEVDAYDKRLEQQARDHGNLIREVRVWMLNGFSSERPVWLNATVLEIENAVSLAARLRRRQRAARATKSRG